MAYKEAADDISNRQLVDKANQVLDKVKVERENHTFKLVRIDSRTLIEKRIK